MTFRMPPDAAPAGLTLRMRDGPQALAFYRDLLGLDAETVDGGWIRLHPGGGAMSLDLLVEPAARPRPPRAIGLYHFALLLPDRAGLAAVLRRLLEARWPLDGASDHGVSEALYLQDPEGNGIELYCDRPRDRWARDRGGLVMVTEALDISDLLATTPAAGPLHPGTRLGHMHLSVADLTAGEAFYAGGLGLNVIQRSYPGALFLAAGDYHHHLGLNIWGSRRPAPDGATGLVRYVWGTPPGTGEALARHLTAQRIPFRSEDGGLVVTDPSGIAVEIAA